MTFDTSHLGVAAAQGVGSVTLMLEQQMLAGPLVLRVAGGAQLTQCASMGVVMAAGAIGGQIGEPRLRQGRFRGRQLVTAPTLDRCMRALEHETTVAVVLEIDLPSGPALLVVTTLAIVLECRAMGIGVAVQALFAYPGQQERRR